tara:strand:- start:201 stop:1517 length:1317 start_codon:yes stop_codon:yes gene_type:complete
VGKKQILFIHQNFPAQFKSLAPYLSGFKEYEIHTLSWKKINKEDSIKDQENFNNMKNITHHQYEVTTGSSKNIVKLAQEFETKMIRADAVAKKCFKLKEQGINPELIINHPGWGETMFINEIWPNSKKLSYFEFYYNTKNSDVDFDEEYKDTNEYELNTKLRARNTALVMPYLDSDMIIAPTNFQKSTAPDSFRNKISVIHDGIDTENIKPGNKNESIDLEYDVGKGSRKKIRLTKKNKIITFVNRNLEPYRGYHSFMRALPKIQKEHPDAYVLIIGGDSYSYGPPPPKSNELHLKSYKQIYYHEVKDKLIDKEKLIYLGKVNYNSYLSLVDLSSVHVYLTYPFVLSWSMLEVMALEKLVIGSKTKPVQEVIMDKENGLLVDFFDIDEISKTVNDVLSNPKKYEKIKKNARKTIIKNYDLKNNALPKQFNLIKELLND